jgi:ribonuclease E
MKKMLINAAAPEELRVATVQDGRLFEFQTESASRQQTTGNIYKVRVVNVEPSLQAAFVDIGTGKNAFLQVDEIHPEYFHGPADVLEQTHPPIQKVIRRNQEILVQVTKEQTELKGASVTTFLSLPGQFLVLMPGR